MSPLSSDEQALLSLVAPDSGTTPPRCTTDVLELAQRRGVGPLVAHRVLNAEVGVDGAARRTAAALVMRTEARAARYAAALNPWIDDLAHRGVPVVLLKGSALAGQLFPRGARRLNDVDVLVRREHAVLALSCLRAAGFTRAAAGTAPDQHFLQCSHALPFSKPAAGGPLMVDVHWALAPADKELDLRVSSFMARATEPGERQPDGLHAARCRAEDIVLHLAGQLVMDGLHVEFSRAVDLAWLVEAGIDWQDLVQQAIGARLAGPMQVALRLAEFAGGRVPCDVLQQLQHANHTASVAADLATCHALAIGRHRLLRATSISLMPLLRDGGRRKVRDALRLLVPNYESALALKILPEGDPAAAWEATDSQVILRTQVLARSLGAGLLVLTRAAAGRAGASNLTQHLDGWLLGPDVDA